VEIVAIGTSTGGPNALAALLPALKEDFSVPIVVVVSYADFITLLFAFFVVLYSSSPVDKRKVGRLAMAVQVACQELGVFDTSNTKVPLSDTEPIPFANIQAVENVERTGDMERFVHPTKGFSAPRPRTVRWRMCKRSWKKLLVPEIKDHTVDVQARKEGLVVSLRELGFFGSGSATFPREWMRSIGWPES
jgi:chemotaxis protein MotB